MDKELLLYNYFSNHLTEDEEKLFNEFLDSDPEFRTKFEFENDLKRVIKDDQNQVLKAKLIGFEKEIATEAPVAKPQSSTIRKWSIAASVALLMGLGWIGYNSLLKTDYENLYAANFQEYPNTVYTITRGDNNASVEREAFVAYESGNYKEAILNFEKVQQEESKGYLDFYKAQAYLNLGDNTAAIPLFKGIQSGESDFNEEANWYLALAYLKQKDKEKAISVLRHHIEKYNYNKEKAVTLLDQLN